MKPETLVAERFRGLGIETHVWPTSDDPSGAWRVDLVRGISSQSYLLVYRPRMSFTEVSAVPHEGAPLLVVGDRVSERSANSFREAGIQYVDAAGNAYLEFGDVLIDIRGRRAAVPARSIAMTAEKSTNLFSPRRAQVIFALLAWPELESSGVRDIASAAGVSPGLAHDTLELLERGRYLDGGHPRRLRRQGSLFDYWTAAYPSGLGASLALAQFAGGVDDLRPVSAQPLFLSGESAVPDLIRPASLTIYVDELDPRLPVANRWRADGTPNIFVRKRFWSPPADEHKLLSGPLRGPERAPWQLIYADLMAAGESRQAEAAQELRNRLALYP